MNEISNGGEPIHVLYLEHSPKDVDLVKEVLEDAGIKLSLKWVSDKASFYASLADKKFDLILSDYMLPGFNASEALKYVQEICPEVPFICISGAIGEETAVELLKKGAIDYVSKNHLSRLPVAINKAILDLAILAERNKAYENLRLSEARLAEAQLIAHLGSWEWDLLTNEVSWSDELCRLFDISQETVSKGIDILRIEIDTRIHPEDLEQYKDVVLQSIAHKIPFSIDYRIILPDKFIRYIHSRGHVLVSEEGIAIKILGTAKDISELKWANTTLAKSENNARALLEAIPDMMFQLSKDGVYLNYKAPLESLAYQAESIIGKRNRNLVSPEFADLVEEKSNLALITGELQIFEYQLPLPGGKIGDYEARMVAGSNESVIAIVRDISDRKLAELLIIEKNEELLKVIAEKDKFFSIIAHDLRSPFNTFLGFTRMMVDEYSSFSPEDIQKINVNLRDSADNLYRLLENLLEWSTMQRGIMHFDPAIYFLDPEIYSALKAVFDVANKKGIMISFSIPDKAEVYVDRNMFCSILRNFVSNAIKFSVKGGTIVISVTQTEHNMVTISVKDSGIGMNKVIADKIFKLSGHANRRGAEGEASTGLGLIICKDFVEKNGGKIWVESEEDKGSTFSFCLPSLEAV